jgi:hypothetical protein
MYFDREGVLKEGAAPLCVLCWKRPPRRAKNPAQQEYLVACKICAPYDDSSCSLEDEGLSEFIDSIDWVL